MSKDVPIHGQDVGTVDVDEEIGAHPKLVLPRRIYVGNTDTHILMGHETYVRSRILSGNDLNSVRNCVPLVDNLVETRGNARELTTVTDEIIRVDVSSDVNHVGTHIIDNDVGTDLHGCRDWRRVRDTHVARIVNGVTW